MNGEIFNMNLFIICFISAALLYVLTLPFVGKRGKRARKKEAPVKQWHSYEKDMKIYNKFVGLPDDAI